MLIIGLLSMPAANAVPPQTTQTEVNYLLALIAGSDCDFYRNGSWYDAKRAEAHLRFKYDYLVAKDQITTTEDFIEKGATRSSWSGRDYEIRCHGHEAVPSSQWLLDQLARYRELDEAISSPGS